MADKQTNMVHRIPPDAANFLSGSVSRYNEDTGAHLVQCGSKTINLNETQRFPDYDDQADSTPGEDESYDDGNGD